MADDRRIITFARADSITPKPTSWLIEDWLVADSLAGLVGPSGSGKTFLALQWGACVATGAPWFGRNVAQGAVFYIAGEGRTGLRKRLAGWEQASGIPLAGAPLFVADNLPALCDEYVTAGICEAIAEIAEKTFFEAGCDPALIVVDTVARGLAGFDENSAADMGKFIRSLDWLRGRFGCCVLALHHTGHGDAAQDRARGSSAFRAALDAEFVIKPGAEVVAVKGTKAKDWPAPLEVTLTKRVLPIELPGLERPETTLALYDGAGMAREQDKRERALVMAQQGMSVRTIAASVGVSKSTVSRWTGRAESGLSHVPP
jgi:hypothetical protein